MKNRIKICFISPYPPGKGGISLYTKRIVDNLRKNNVDVNIIPFNNPKDIKKIYLELNKIKPDIIRLEYTISIYGISSFSLFKLLRKFKRKNKTKLVVNFHEVKRDTDFFGYFGIKYYSLISNLFNKIYVHTNEAKEILIKRCNIHKNKIKIIPHGTYEFEEKRNLEKEIRKKYNLDNKNVILFFGYIHIDKGIEYLISAGEILFKTYPNLKKDTMILITGDVRHREGFFKIFEKKDRYYLKKLINLKEKLNLKDNVKFIGSIEDKYVYSMINLSKLVVLPYTNAEQSGVLNLVLAVHKPIIASNIGGLGETLKDSGVLVPPKDCNKIAKEMLKLLNNRRYYNSVVKKYIDIEREQNTDKINKIIIKELRNLI